MTNFSNRLAWRLALLLTLALAPLGSIAIFAEYESWRTQRAAQDSNLVSRTLDAVTGQRAILESALSSAGALAPRMVDTLNDSATCSGLLEQFIRESGFFAFAGFVGVDGLMTCSSQGGPLDFRNSPFFQEILASPRRTFSFRDAGLVTGQPVVIVTQPLVREETLLGFLIISIARARFDMIATAPTAETAPKAVFLVNHHSDTMSQSELADPDLKLPEPGKLAEFLEARNGVFRARSVSGDVRVFTLSEIVPRRLFVLGSWEDDDPQVRSPLSLWRLGFPLVMWLASIAVVMLAVHYLVVRHLRQINSQLRRFALGNREEFRRLPQDAPSELRELDSTFSKMARLIRRDEVERENALREKTILLKEVHHRVKNNLQLIASILNLQFRRLKDPQARAILKGVQLRVRSLASIHRTLYEKNRISAKNATAFFDAILSETLALSQPEVSGLTIDTEFDPVNLPPDKIIPAALLFAEAVTNALKYATPHAGQTTAQIKISCLPQDSHAELRVYNSLSEAGPKPANNGLGQELMMAFALQVDAEFEIGPVEDERGFGWEMCLRLSQADAEEDAAEPQVTMS